MKKTTKQFLWSRDQIVVGRFIFEEKNNLKIKNFVELKNRVILIVPVDKNYVYLLKEYRPLLGKSVWRVPAGTLRKNENPTKGARRELFEETGLTARKVGLVKYYEYMGWVKFPIYLFKATGLNKPRGQQLDFYENINLKKVTKKQAMKIALNEMVEPHHAFAVLKCLS